MEALPFVGCSGQYRVAGEGRLARIVVPRGMMRDRIGEEPGARMKIGSTRRRTLLALALVLPLTASSCSGSSQEPSPASSSTASTAPASSPSTSPFVGEEAWIAYQTDRTGAEGVWLIHPDGTEDHQIATDVSDAPGGQLLPDWSPDGTRIVFTTRGGTTEPLYVYDLATERSTQLFDCLAPCLGDDEPVFSPDGAKVAFERALGPIVTSAAEGGDVPSDCSLWIGDVASGQVTQVTSNTHPPCDREYNPRWSPDGSQLTYWRDPYDDGAPTGTAAFVIDADGTHERRLTDPTMFAGEADWSPDGRWIVFDTYPLAEFGSSEVSNLYRIHPDGSGMEPLTNYTDADQRATQPRYTPDGRWIVFTAVTPSSRSLWAIPATGGEPVVIASGGIYTHGTWQP